MKIIPGSQYDDAYWIARRGKITASEMGNILTPTTCKLAAAADTYACRLVGDVLDLEYPRKDEYATAAMKRGTMMEPESRRYYEMESGQEVQQVSLCLTDDERFAGSPDGLIAEDGVLECKNPMPATQAKWLLDGTLPPEHKGQAHGLLIVTGRPWLDWLSYCPGFRPLLIRVKPDEYTAKLAEALEGFWDRYQAMLTFIKEGVWPKTTKGEK